MRRKPAQPKPLRIQCTFVGQAAESIRALHKRGLHGPTVKLVVEGLALSALRRETKPVRLKSCARCGDDGNPCSMCGACGQKKIPCDPISGDELE